MWTSFLKCVAYLGVILEAFPILDVIFQVFMYLDVILEVCRLFGHHS
jgi:hypothetical protein